MPATAGGGVGRPQLLRAASMPARAAGTAKSGGKGGKKTKTRRSRGYKPPPSTGKVTISTLRFEPGWRRSGPDGNGSYRFTKDGKMWRGRPTDPPVALIRRTIVLYVLANGNGFFAEKQEDGTYSISRRVKPSFIQRLRSSNKLRPAPENFSARMKSNDSLYVNGGVPLYTLFNTNKIQNLRGNMQTVPKYTQFNSEGRWVTDPRFPQELSTNEKMKLVLPPPEPPLCPGEKLDLRDQNSCFVKGMRARLASTLAQLKDPGRDACATKTAELQPHQRAVFNLARTMATRTPEELNGYRGLLCWHNTGSGKSLDEDTRLVRFSGELVRAGDLEIGMELLGMDGTPRRVLDVGRGIEDMYEIRPTKGEAWRCNSSHILSLRYNRQGTWVKTRHDTYTVFWHEYEGGRKDGTTCARGMFRCRNFKTQAEAEAFAATIPKDHVVDIPLQEYLRLPIYMRHYLKLFRTGRVSFAPREAPRIEPYTLGAWLGDGHSNGPEITCNDPEIIDQIRQRTGLEVTASRYYRDRPDKATRYRIRAPEGARKNPMTEALVQYDLLHNKHIPDDVKCGSVDTRLAVLAGLLDTDGYLQGNCYEITQKSSRLAEDIAFVARSLGFAAYVKQVEKTCVKPGGERVPGTYYRLNISGAGLEDLPLVVPRKRAEPRQQVKDALCTGFDVVPVGLGKYVGPVLDGDHRYCLWDFTVTHNTVTSLGIVLAFWDSPRNIVLATTPANEADNNLSKYALNLFCFYPEFVNKVFKSPPSPYPPPPWTLGSEPLKQWCNNKDNIKSLTNRVRTYTFTTLASELCLPKEGALGRSNPLGPKLLQGGTAGCKGGGAGRSNGNGGSGKIGSVLIMDEVQSLFTPDPKYARAAKYLVPLLTSDDYRKKMFVFALTATPGNKVSDMLDVLNFVRPMGTPAFTTSDAKNNPEKFAGLVSYVDIRSDTTRYGQKSVKNVYVEMSPRYYAGFLKTISLADSELNYSRFQKASKEAGFMIKQRTAGNFLIKSALGGLYTDEELRRFAASRPVPRAVVLGGNQMRVLSDKLMGVLENATSMPGKQYVWVAELNTAKVLVAALTKMGYTQVLPKDYSKARDDKGKTIFKPSERLKSPGKRFILYKKGTANGEQLDEGILTAFAQTFSNRDNDNGDKVKIMLATETYYQGLDMRALQGVHLVDSLFNATADKQAVGRALRLCGHSGAPYKKVTVYRYFSTPPAKFDAESVAAGAKGAAKSKISGLGQLNKRLRGLPPADVFKGVRLPEGQNSARVPPGVNTFVYANAARRQQPVENFELALKAFAVDCPLFKDAYHSREPFQCGVKPAPGAFVNTPGKTLAGKPAAGKPAAGKPKPGFLSGLFGGGGNKKNNQKPKPIGTKPVVNKPSAPPMPPSVSKLFNTKPSAPPMPSSVAAMFGNKTMAGIKKAKKPERVNNKGRRIVTNASVFFQPTPTFQRRTTKQPARLAAPASTLQAKSRPATPPPVTRRNAQKVRNALEAAERIREQRRKNEQRRQQRRG